MYEAELVQATKAQTEALLKLTEAVLFLGNALAGKLDRLAVATEKQAEIPAKGGDINAASPATDLGKAGN